MKTKAIVLLIASIFIIGACSGKKKVSIDASKNKSERFLYEEGVKIMKKHAQKARLYFREVIQVHPDSIYAKKAKIRIADTYYFQKDTASLIMAAAEYQEYVNLYPNTPDAVYAKLQYANCYYKRIHSPGRDQSNTKDALKAFEGLVKLYPETEEAAKAKEKIAELRQNLAEHYYTIGYYNHKFGAFKGAVARFKQVINEYPEFKKNDELFYYAGKSYYHLMEFDSALSFFRKVITSFPDSKLAKKAGKMIKKIEGIDREALHKKIEADKAKRKAEFEKRNKKS